LTTAQELSHHEQHVLTWSNALGCPEGALVSQRLEYSASEIGNPRQTLPNSLGVGSGADKSFLGPSFAEVPTVLAALDPEQSFTVCHSPPDE